MAPSLFEISKKFSKENVLDAFLAWSENQGLALYPHQEEAILALYAGHNVILATPTGSGKTLVALALQFKTWMEGGISFYTAPIKALANEKFLTLCRDLGPENVGLATGDALVNPEASLQVCTAEILAYLALREGSRANVQAAILDEFHFYTDRDRGWAWQVPLLELSKTQFLLISATIGNPEFFKEVLEKRNGRETLVIESRDRPVPLKYTYSEMPLESTLQECIRQGQAPVYVVHFSQREATEWAQNLLSYDFASRDIKLRIAEELKGFKFSSPFGKTLERSIRAGVGIHHAGLLPKYRLLVEKLSQKGLMQIISGTDTLGVGINVPIRTVVLNKLCKYDGHKTRLLPVRDFLQITGRAGRKGYDNEGFVIAEAPEHVIENLKIDAKIKLDPSKRKKLVKKKPPEKGFVHYDKETFERLQTSPPEALTSRFRITPSIALYVLSRPQGHLALRALIENSHESENTKRSLKRQALNIFRSLRDRGIFQIIPAAARVNGNILKLNVDLQRDFSLHHELSLFLFDNIQNPSLAEHPEYPFVAVSLIECILEDPDKVIFKQTAKLRSIRYRELKGEGASPDQIREELDKVEAPKPNLEYLSQLFIPFLQKHALISPEDFHPKSVAREMYEGFYSFNEYVRELDLERSEGSLLHYLNDFVKVVSQNIPDSAKTPAILEMELYFTDLLASVDQSLFDEWKRLHSISSQLALAKGEISLDPAPKPVPIGPRVRHQIRILLRTLSRLDTLHSLADRLPVLITFEGSLTASILQEKAWAEFMREIPPYRIRLDQEAFSDKWVQFLPSKEHPETVIQRILTLDGETDWNIELKVKATGDAEGLGFMWNWITIRRV